MSAALCLKGGASGVLVRGSFPFTLIYRQTSIFSHYRAESAIDTGGQAAVISQHSVLLQRASGNPQDFILFLIDQCQDLSANAGQGSSLDDPCEVPAVLLFNLLSRLKLLFGMSLSHLVLQVDGVSLLLDVLGALIVDEDDDGVDVHVV